MIPLVKKFSFLWAYRNTIDVCILTLYLKTLLNSNYNNLSGNALQFSLVVGIIVQYSKNKKMLKLVKKKSLHSENANCGLYFKMFSFMKHYNF